MNQLRRSSAYSKDLQWKIIWHRLALEFPTKVVAKNLCIEDSTMLRICQTFYSTGTIRKREYPVERAFRKLTEPAKYFILNLVLERPDIYLR